MEIDKGKGERERVGDGTKEEGKEKNEPGRL